MVGTLHQEIILNQFMIGGSDSQCHGLARSLLPSSLLDRFPTVPSGYPSNSKGLNMLWRYIFDQMSCNEMLQSAAVSLYRCIAVSRSWHATNSTTWVRPSVGFWARGRKAVYRFLTRQHLFCLENTYQVKIVVQLLFSTLGNTDESRWGIALFFCAYLPLKLLALQLPKSEWSKTLWTVLMKLT